MSVRNRKLNRLVNYDYSKEGFYYVTICTKDRQNWFGQIQNGEVILNEYGRIVNECWLNLPNHYWNCRLDEYVLMLDHFHGIIVVDNNVVDNNGVGNGFKPFRTKQARARHGLCEFIRAFKTFSSRRINQKCLNNKFQWHKSFHDRIIRNNGELEVIRMYIRENPLH